MNTILQTIQNIAVDIEQTIFQNYNDEVQKNLNKTCDKIFLNIASENNIIKAICSQHNKQLKTINDDGRYILTYIAIDNADLLSLAFSVGTIITIYDGVVSNDTIVASSYITYGPTFQLVFAEQANHGKKVKFLSYKNNQFVHNTDIILKNKGKINSTAGDRPNFSIAHKEQMKSFFDEGYRLRFSGSLSLDTHQILFKKGGLYSNPDKSSLAFEAYCIANIIESCGGYATNGQQRILDISLDDDMQKTSPFYFGSKYEMDKIQEFNAK